MGMVTWMIVGLFVDAYFHSTDPGLESFWTPWHAIFYSGFTATALWMVRLAFRSPGAPSSGGFVRALLDRAPAGYRLAMVGLGVFAAGGIGDAIWHEVLGIEADLAALLSPTHLLLFVGMLLIASAPFRAAWQDRGAAASWSDSFPAFLSLTWSTALVAFFLEYLWLPTQDWVPRIVYDQSTGEGSIGAVLGIAGVVVTSAILFGAMALAHRRWTQLPLGVATMVFAVITIFIAVGFDEDPVGVPAAVAAGVVADLAARRWSWAVSAGLSSGVLWAGYLVAVDQVENGLGWPPEIIGGVVFFGVATAVAMAMIAGPGGFPRYQPSERSEEPVVA